MFNCVTCRKLRGKMGVQIMADLPKDRFQEAAPFTYCAVDIFGPFKIKVKRSEVKRYVAMFTCLASRAIHIKVSHSMITDSLIQALRRLIATRGNVRQIPSDNGPNLVGVEQELIHAFNEMDYTKIQDFLQNNNADWIQWERNPPAAIHMGGIWEHQNRSARCILASLLQTHGDSLDEETFQTLMAEKEAVFNSRPLTVETINEGQGFKPLSPNNLLTTTSKVVMPPLEVFRRLDLYCRQRWRRVQHITNEFWCRWRKEFVRTHQERQKWTTKNRNFRIIDIVLLKEDAPRNRWPLCKIIKTNPDDQGTVRSVTLLLCIDNENNCERMLERLNWC